MRFLPNALTISRILITPVLLWLYFVDTTSAQVWAFVLFVAAAISDYLDGKLARDFGARSRLGQYLDPLADKVLVLGTFAVLAYLMPQHVPVWGVALIALRDVLVTALRTAAESRGRSLATLQVARQKTLVQLIFLIAVLLLRAMERLPAPLSEIARAVLSSWAPLVVMIGVVAFTVYTGVVYVLRRDAITTLNTNG